MAGFSGFLVAHFDREHGLREGDVIAAEKHGIQHSALSIQ